MIGFTRGVVAAITSDGLGLQDWLQALGTVLAAVVAAMVVNRLTRRALTRGVGTGFAALVISRLLAYVVFLLGLFYALNGLGVQVGPLLGALGLGGLVLALALQKIVENFIASIILQTRRPFTIGETVRIGEYVGSVADIDARTTVLNGLDGTIIRIPNSTVITETIVNLTRQPQRRSSVTVGVAYESNLADATEALKAALRLVPRVLADPPASVILSSFSSSTIDFTVYYWHASDVASEYAARHDLMLAIHQTFDAEGITIAFPQLVVWPAERRDGPIYPNPADVIRTPLPGDTPPDRGTASRSARWRRGRP